LAQEKGRTQTEQAGERKKKKGKKRLASINIVNNEATRRRLLTPDDPISAPMAKNMTCHPRSIKTANQL
jgi:hypothetical protein